ncbi:hypothetical protein TRV_03741 [Trichophyton verrucosum HKI 0517]|uniref:Uncharacterized protein n=1 Tax=Trichophyton verrucosum (strain HKI 0517) TaxID=663202 RepID=D4D9F0_TRIVH|nr:uncharacterized protein TRV_03741 [Trichophyton verrucosum HKI 0517]EFE41520.1 hypothetical protein TRV_03741 [Trichophyton verrucosum HKI 0517]
MSPSRKKLRKRLVAPIKLTALERQITNGQKKLDEEEEEASVSAPERARPTGRVFFLAAASTSLSSPEEADYDMIWKSHKYVSQPSV